MKVKTATKTVNYETLKKALIKYYNDHYNDRYNDRDRGILANRLASFVFISLKSKWHCFLPCDTTTEITKIKEDCYKVEGKFAENYLK